MGTPSSTLTSRAIPLDLKCLPSNFMEWKTPHVENILRVKPPSVSNLGSEKWNSSLTVTQGAPFWNDLFVVGRKRSPTRRSNWYIYYGGDYCLWGTLPLLLIVLLLHCWYQREESTQILVLCRIYHTIDMKTTGSIGSTRTSLLSMRLLLI